MKKIIAIFLITILIGAITTSGINDNNSSKKVIDLDIIDFIEMVNETIVREYLTSLVSFGPHPSESENCSRVADYLYHEFEDMGLDVNFDPWSYPLIKDKNVVATLYGNNITNDGMYIFCAHYDTWWNSTGANDDCSGVAVVLAIAKILSQYNFEHTIRFILFSGHESAPLYTYGSFAYAKKAYYNDENIFGVINLDAVGSTGDSGDALRLSTSSRQDFITSVTEEIAEKYHDIINIKIQTTILDNIGLDHQSFIDYGYDAITYIQANCASVPEHCPGDNIDIIEFPFLTNVTKLTLAVAVELASTPIALQVQFNKPGEGFLYLNDKPITQTLGFNIRQSGLRGLTYMIGSFTATLDINTDDDIYYAYFSIDKQLIKDGLKIEPPYDCIIKKSSIKPYLPSGKHTLSVIVSTTAGDIAYDEMDIFTIL